jgi:hypothetical protein
MRQLKWKNVPVREDIFSHADTLCFYYYSDSESRFKIWRLASPRDAPYSHSGASNQCRLPRWGPKGLQANLSQKTLRSMKHFPSFYVFIGEERIS